MRLTKRLFNTNFVKNLASKLIFIYLRLVYITSKWNIIFPEGFNIETLRQNPAIYLFWHGRLSVMSALHPKNRKMNVLISTHRDGELIAKTVQNFSFEIINGSSNRNSLHAVREILRKLKNGENISITPDGPRGPRYKINGNVVEIAQLSNAPLIPLTFVCTKCRIFKSWDEFILPFPFNNITVVYGKPFHIQKNDDAQQKQIELEQEMNDINRKAELLSIKV
jgi:lysophospholipid acyltransferase (LPLAT)-like uncharacterized protein